MLKKSNLTVIFVRFYPINVTLATVPIRLCGKLNYDFDTKEGAFSAPSGFPIIVPGKPEESELVLRITHEDIDRRMPPQTSNRQPTQEQIDTLIQWIAEGAEWEEHWAYDPPKRVEPPEVKKSDWVRNPIDQFILSKLEVEGLEPSV